jgi:hypothetical protein
MIQLSFPVAKEHVAPASRGPAKRVYSFRLPKVIVRLSQSVTFLFSPATPIMNIRVCWMIWIKMKECLPMSLYLSAHRRDHDQLESRKGFLKQESGEDEVITSAVSLAQGFTSSFLVMNNLYHI